jgi:predicted NodU family carbamoyl transferase
MTTSRHRPSVFDDDEPPPPLLLDQVQEDDGVDVVVQLKTRCEHPAVARDTARDSFAVLVHAKAPAATPELVAPPLDIVTVLDVSGSMAGYKLALLKQAMMSFVIDRLGPRDRLSIVAFACEARRILGLTRMSDGGKATAKAAVESLVTQAGTDIGGGLRVAAEVLDGRRHRNVGTCTAASSFSRMARTTIITTTPCASARSADTAASRHGP